MATAAKSGAGGTDNPSPDASDRTANLNKDAANAEPERFTVTSPDGRRTLFEGNEDDAYAYVERNFPNVHAEPGQHYGERGPAPDAVVRDSSDGVFAFVGGEWGDWSDDDGFSKWDD